MQEHSHPVRIPRARRKEPAAESNPAGPRAAWAGEAGGTAGTRTATPEDGRPTDSGAEEGTFSCPIRYGRFCPPGGCPGTVEANRP